MPTTLAPPFQPAFFRSGAGASNPATVNAINWAMDSSGSIPSTSHQALESPLVGRVGRVLERAVEQAEAVHPDHGDRRRS